MCAGRASPGRLICAPGQRNLWRRTLHREVGCRLDQHNEHMIERLLVRGTHTRQILPRLLKNLFARIKAPANVLKPADSSPESLWGILVLIWSADERNDLSRPAYDRNKAWHVARFQ